MFQLVAEGSAEKKSCHRYNRKEIAQSPAFWKYVPSQKTICFITILQRRIPHYGSRPKMHGLSPCRDERHHPIKSALLLQSGTYQIDNLASLVHTEQKCYNLVCTRSEGQIATTPALLLKDQEANGAQATSEQRGLLKCFHPTVSSILTLCLPPRVHLRNEV
jgi:hypothetical protein